MAALLGCWTLGPGLGNCGSVEGVVLHELMDCRLATKSSGKEVSARCVRLAERKSSSSSSSSRVLRFLPPPVTVMGAQFCDRSVKVLGEK